MISWFSKVFAILPYVIIAVLCGVLYSKQSDITEYEKIMARQAHNISTLQANQVQLESNLERLSQTLVNSKDEAENIQRLLSKCYDAKDEQQKHLDEIERIMSSKDDTDTPTEGEYEKVTPSQTAAGLGFVNRQLSRLN